jgi:hypothetical protein
MALNDVVRRHAAALVLVAAMAWIITIVVLVVLNPEPATGNPMA